MRGFSLIQPWASLIAHGHKRIETRSWRTNYRGIIAIHASKGFPRDCMEACLYEPFRSALADSGYPTIGALPRGAIVAVGNLHKIGTIFEAPMGDIRIIGQELPIRGDELSFGDYTPGRYGWVITNVHPLPEPIPCKGSLGLWQVPDDIAEQLRQVYP